MNRKVLFMVQLAIFTAIEAVFCFTVLGSIPIGPIVMTLSHIPPLVAALTLGKRAGMFVGGIFGVCSLLVWTFMCPNPAVAFAFTPFMPNGNFMSLVIALVPRILFPLFASLIYDALKKHSAKPVAAVIAGIGGTFVHSLMVLSLIFVSFSNDPTVGGDYITFVIAWAGVNALIEMALGGFFCGALIVPLSKVNKPEPKTTQTA